MRGLGLGYVCHTQCVDEKHYGEIYDVHSTIDIQNMLDLVCEPACTYQLELSASMSHCTRNCLRNPSLFTLVTNVCCYILKVMLGIMLDRELSFDI